MAKPKLSRGMFLISTLLLSVVVALFVGAGLKMATSNLKANQRDAHRALFAAESGLRYVQSRQASDYTWTADGGLVVNEPDLVVHEDQGNIVGILRTEGGDYAQFRVRFNYQDDSAGDADGRPDPNLYFIDSAYVSVNNLLGGSPVSVPRAEGPSWEVTSSSPSPYKVPTGTMCVIVEGRYGPGLNLDPSSLNPSVQGKVTTRVVEAYLEAPAPPGADSAAMAGRDMDFYVEGSDTVTLSAKDDELASRVRSRANISVQGGGSPNLVSRNGETYTYDGSLQADADSNIQPLTEDTSRSFYQLSWSDVRQATSSDPTLPAGTYVIWDDGSLHYYDMSYREYAAHIELNPTDAGNTLDPSNLPAGMTLDTSDPTKPRITINQNLFVEETGNTDEFSLIPRKGAQEDPPDGSDDLASMASEAAGNLAPGYVGGSVADATRIEVPPDFVSPGNVDLDIPVAGAVAIPFRVYLHNDHIHVLNYTLPNILQSPLDMATLMSQPGLDATQQAQAETILAALGGSAPMKELNVGGQPANLRADDLTVEFAPNEGEAAILSAKGDVRLGANVVG